jgi:hypothetical protein
LVEETSFNPSSSNQENEHHDYFDNLAKQLGMTGENAGENTPPPETDETTALADNATRMATAFAGVVGKPITTDEDAEFELAALHGDTFAKIILDMQGTIRARERNLFKLEKKINSSIHGDTIESARKLLQQMNIILDQNKKIYYKMKEITKGQTKTLPVRQFKTYYGQFKNLNALLISLLEKVKTKTRSVKKLTKQNAKTRSPTTRPGRKLGVPAPKTESLFSRLFGSKSSSKTPSGKTAPKTPPVESSRFNPADWPDRDPRNIPSPDKVSSLLEKSDERQRRIARRRKELTKDNPFAPTRPVINALRKLQFGGKTKINRKTNANKKTRKSQNSKSQNSKSQKSKVQKSKVQKSKSQKSKKRMNATRKRRSHKNHGKRYYLKTLKSRR